MLIGVFASGLVQQHLSAETLTRWLPQRRLAVVLLSSVFGFVAPVCDCGVIPLARRLGDTLTVVDVIGETVRGIRRHPGEAFLVVGHSNTLPQILAALTQRSELDTLRVGYDDLFVLTLGPGRASRLVRLHYGAPTQFFR